MDFSLINIIFNIAGVLGGVAGAISVFFAARKKGIAELQEKTIITMQQNIEAQKTRIETLEAKQNELEKENGGLRVTINTILQENYSLRQKIELILAALLKKGIHVTIDGETITISDVTRPQKRNATPKKPEKEQTEHA